MPIVVELFVIREDITIKVDGGGVAFSLDTMHRQQAVMVRVLPFDTTQITSGKNWSHPKYGDPCHPLASGQHPPTVVIEVNNELSERDRSINAGSASGQL